MTKTNAQVQGISEALGNASGSLVALSKINVPYTTITNRAQVIDFSKDLLPRMGIQRIPVQSITAVAEEFGPLGERVFKSPNDVYDQIRFVGVWENRGHSTSEGMCARTASTAAYVEVVFYGTGLNILLDVYATAASQMNVSIDGGADVAVSTITANNVLDGRKYRTNQAISLIGNVTIPSVALGLHTAKITMTGGAAFVYGFETICDQSTLKTSPGTAFAAGKKQYLSSLNSQTYNSVFASGTLGTRGGRVLTYLLNGEVKKAVTPAGSQQNLASANHSNENVTRVYDYGEFSSGRIDDFLAFAGGANRAFTLEDGVTNLSAVSIDLSASLPGVRLGTLSGYLTFTFVGTGLDVLRADDSAAAGDTLGVIVDGTSIGNLSTSTSSDSRWEKIVSGLPYGTHVVRITFSASGGGNRSRFSAFRTYSPAKPALPDGAVELADYCILADYVPNSTAGMTTIATGVIRKSCSREWVYSLGAWSIALGPDNSIGGWEATTTVSGAGAYIYFFGTGFEVRGRSSVGYTATTSITLMAQNDTNKVLNSTNFPGLSTSSYGGWTFTYSTGNLDTSGAATAGSGFRVSGLPLGFYRLRIANSTANTFRPDSIDIITPVYSPDDNLPGNLQNTLPSGSNSIGDSRPLPSSVDLDTPNWSQAVGAGTTSSITTTSTSFVPLTDMQCVVKTNGRPLSVSYSISATNDSPPNFVETRATVDGVEVPGSRRIFQPTTANYNGVLAGTFIVPAASGVHIIMVEWLVTAGTGTTGSWRRSLSVQEL